MTNDQLNAIWHDVIEGKCPHTRQFVGKVPDCEICADGRKPSWSIPAYDEDPAVAWDCVVRLWDDLCVINKFMCKQHPDDPEQYSVWTEDEQYIASDPNPQRAAMLAVLKMEGVDYNAR